MRLNQPSTEMHSLRVLHIGKYFPPYAGGMETYLRDLMVAQTEQGLKSTALVHQSALSLRSSTEQYLAGEQTLSVTRAAVWLRLLFTPISPSFPWLLNRLVKEKKPDLLHLHMPNVSVFWALLLPRARRLPWVVHWQADVMASSHSLGLRIFYIFYRYFEHALLKRSSAIIVTSPPYLESSWPLKNFRDKCRIVPLGIDPDNLPHAAVRPKVTDKHAPLRVLAIGRLTYYKGFEYLIRAAANCDAVEIHIVGQGQQDTRLRSLVNLLGIQSRVTFCGYLSEIRLAEQFLACDCLCLPSLERTEAFGLVLLEAMYHAKAVVVSNVEGSGMGWVVDDEVTGIHLATGDVTALSAALGNLHQDRDKVTRLGANGRLKFERQFHINKSAVGVAEVYSDIFSITGKHGPAGK